MTSLRGFVPLLVLPLATTTPARAQGIDTAAVDHVFAAYDHTNSPGCALGVYRDGQIAYQRGYGMANLDLGVPITSNTFFDIGSTSKQFTAASIALLVGDGKISFDDDVRKYVPEVPDYGTPITIENLIRHTSGLRDYNGLLFLAGHQEEDYTNDADGLDIIARQRALNFKPGTRWDYSNTGFFLLSVIVERVSGKTLSEFAKERIFAPLGMTETNFRTDHTQILPGRAVGYAPRPEGGFRIEMSDWDQTGDGAVNTSINELIRWDENFYHPIVGGQAMVDRLQAPGTLDDGTPHGYGRGLFVDTYRGLRRVHHGGAWAGYRAMLMRFPERHTSVGLLCNLASASTQTLSEQVADVVIGSGFPEAKPATAQAAEAPAAPTTPVNAARYAGLYFSTAEQGVVRIAAQDGGIAAGVFGATLPLRPTGPDQFTSTGFPVVIGFGGAASGRADTLRLSVLGDQRVYTRVAEAHPTAADLAELAGSYYSPELDVTWRVALEDGKAVLHARGLDNGTLEPAMKDGFTGGTGFARFLRDPRGRIVGFDLSASRTQGIRFERRR